MTTTTINPREAAIEVIRKLPADVTVPDIMASLYVRLAIEEGLAQLDRGEGIPHDEAMKRVEKWLK